jgi:TonB-linked SusC/RagA family outer membrane protein
MSVKLSALVLFTMSMLAGHIVHAQEVIKGHVTDQSGVDLEGVTVQSKLTHKATTTNGQGNFEINVKIGDQLAFTFVGYKRKNVIVSGPGKLTVVLVSDQTTLNDAVVIGYGTVRRKDLTGAVGSMNMADFDKAPVRSFDEALAGRLAGVQVASTEGQPGSAINIIIRGNNSITQDNSPLYVIDGFPVENPDPNLINPADIETYNVLKDASATAIYGARGANGVIIITTKRGKIGVPTVSYNGYYGVQKNIKTMQMMSPYEFVKLQKEIGVNLDSNYLANGVTVDDYKNVKGINWQDQLYRTAPMMNHSLSLSGGTEKTRYIFSGNYFGQDGIILNSGFKRYQGKMSLDQTVNEKVKVGLNVVYTGTQTYGTQPSASSGSSMNNLLYSVWGYRPVAPLRPVNSALGDDFADDLEDDIVNSGTDYRLNPIILAKHEYRKKYVNNLLANSYLDLNILKNLKLRSTAIFNKTIQHNDAFNDSLTRSGIGTYGVNGSVIYYETANFTNENTLTYDKTFNQVHKLTAMAGFSDQVNHYQYYGMWASQLPNPQLGLKGLSQGTPQPVSSYAAEWSAASFLARVFYSYKDKYLLTLSVRDDGTSKFKSSKQWSVFPSGAFAWRVINEPFMKDLTWVSDAKVRVGWGKTGNNRVSEYATYSTMNFPLTGYYSFGNGLEIGGYPSGLASEDLQWESTAQTDVGLDLSFLNNRISFTADYYKKITDKLLLNADLPPTTGYGKAYKNIGKTSNEGLELALSTTNVQTKAFSWSSSINISFNRSKVLALTQNQETLTSTMGWDSFFGDPLYLAKLGQPLGQFYGYIFDGVYQYSDFNVLPNGTYLLKDDRPTNGNTRANIKPGDIRYKDLDGDKVVNANDRTFIGRGFPIHYGGFSNNFRYKNFDLNVFFQWSYGNDIYNANRQNFENGNKFWLNQYASFENRWTPDHTNTNMPRAGGQPGYMYSTRLLEDGSYLRLKTVSLGYHLPNAWLRKVSIKSGRIYVSAQNLVTWTKYTGSDPEVSINYSALTPGFDYSSYPRARTMVAGLSLSF